MDIFLNILLLIAGMIFLIKGADAFVDGASDIAKYLKIPALIIGLTIVALGTSLPELAVSVVAAIGGSVDLSVSNVVGSNIFNTLVVLGCSALILPIAIEKKVLRFELPFLLFVSFFLLIISLTGSRSVTWYYGLIFLILTVADIVFLILRSKKEASEKAEDKAVTKRSLIKSVVFLIVGAIVIAVGGEAVNRSAKVLAAACGMDEKLIGLTIVALGTSLPELATSMIAAKKGENDIALGNVIGSNTLNILFILGVSSLMRPLPIHQDLILDISVMIFTVIVVMILALLTMKKKGLFRVSGAILLFIYAVYLTYIICRNYGMLPEMLTF